MRAKTKEGDKRLGNRFWEMRAKAKEGDKRLGNRF